MAASGKPAWRIEDLADATGVPGPADAPPPVLAAVDAGDGPSVVVCGGIHGDEHEAQIVLTDLVRTLDPAAVRGRLVVIPVLNYPAAMLGVRVNPDDGQNMNRVFPGAADGTPTERIAHFLTHRILPGADLLIDVHAGGQAVAVVPMVFGFSGDGCRTRPDRLREIMRRWGYGRIQTMGLNTGTVCDAALGLGVASVEVEGGGGGAVRRAELDLMRAGIVAGLVASGVLAGSPAAAGGIEFDAPEAGQIHAPVAGAVEHRVPLGAAVEAGEIIALLHRIGGPPGEPVAVAAPVRGIVLRQSQSAFLRRGAQVGNIGVLRDG